MSCSECGHVEETGNTPNDWLGAIHGVLAKTYAPDLMKDVEELKQLRVDFADLQESLHSTMTQLDHAKKAEDGWRNMAQSMSPEGIQRAEYDAAKAKSELATERLKFKATCAEYEKRAKHAAELVERLNATIADLEASNLRLRKQMAGELP